MPSRPGRRPSRQYRAAAGWLWSGAVLWPSRAVRSKPAYTGVVLEEQVALHDPQGRVFWATDPFGSMLESAGRERSAAVAAAGAGTPSEGVGPRQNWKWSVRRDTSLAHFVYGGSTD